MEFNKDNGDGDKSLTHADVQHGVQSTMHMDFQAPPPAPLNQAQPTAKIEVASIPFEGESSMKAHYQAPSGEALRAASNIHQQSDMQAEEHKVHFEGQSTMHHDYQAPPLEKLLQFLGRPDCSESAPPVPFEGESSMKTHYPAPSTEALLAASNTTLRHAVQDGRQEEVRFEGQSTSTWISKHHQQHLSTKLSRQPRSKLLQSHLKASHP